MEQSFNTQAVVLATHHGANSNDDILMWLIMTMAFIVIFAIVALLMTQRNSMAT
jgi:hypothetical protein